MSTVLAICGIFGPMYVCLAGYWWVCRRDAAHQARRRDDVRSAAQDLALARMAPVWPYAMLVALREEDRDLQRWIDRELPAVMERELDDMIEQRQRQAEMAQRARQAHAETVRLLDEQDTHG